MKILLAEDEFLSALWIRTELENQGFEITRVYQTGKGAIDGLSEDKPDVLILDINLTDDIDGIRVGEQAGPNIPIIYITAYTDKVTIEKASKTQPVAIIEKPIDIDRLIQTVNDLRAKRA